MSRNHLIVTVCVSVAFFVVVQSQNRRCFQFTWLGNRYNNESVFLNATCKDATKLSKGIPCFEPLVVSYDGSWPDLDYIWKNHREKASCVLANNDVCAQYTYYFNGIVENSTYMCSRAVDNEDTAITSGCYQQTNGSWSTRVCLCRSLPNGMPCNSAASINPFAIFSCLLVALLINLIKIKT